MRGSGYLLDVDLVLTAGHVVADLAPGELRVCHLPTLHTVPAVVEWTEGDLALLRTAENVVGAGELNPLALRELAADARFEDCAALGLPAVMTRVAAGVAPLEAVGRIAPNTADGHGYFALELDGNPPEGAAPWSGMSGAPVFHAGRWLVGVVVRDSAGWGHARLEAVPAGALRDAPPLAGLLVRNPWPIREEEARDAAFLDTYREEVIQRYGHIELFGLGLHGHFADDIGTEAAYVSLRAGLPAAPGLSLPDQARPVEGLIAANGRLLLRGEPGAGKSTLLEWLAVTMSRGACKGPLAPFNDQVPFLVRLRDMYAPWWKQVEGRDGIPPDSQQFLAFNRMAADSAAPDGWTRRMLEQGRALLLVDGLDEVLEAHRDGVLRWIHRLIRRYPRLRVIVTGRPEAVRGWSPPEKLGFKALKLLELNEEQRTELIHKWHRAAIAGIQSSWLGDEERKRRIDRLSALESALTKHINESEDLSALAATPLLCAVLCKLHEVHGTRLPRFRQELYRRTIDMMLGLRDSDREVPDPLPRLDVDQRRAILSWIAGYLTTEGEREITPERFDEKVQDRLLSLGRDAGTHTAEEIRKGLYERSGLLVAPGESALQFSHRTFQDYLAATDMVAQRSFGQLAGHAGDETWDDVLRFAMSQCNLADTREFVGQIRRKLKLVANGRQRARMRMAAAACIPYAVQMDEADREELIAGVAKTFRSAVPKVLRSLVSNRSFVPRVAEKSFDLSPYVAVGPDLLAALQRDFDWEDSDLAHGAISLAAELGGPEAFRFLTQIPFERRQALSQLFVNAWERFPGAEYAQEVLAGLDLEVLGVTSPEQLAQAQVCGRVHTLVVVTDIPVGAIVFFAVDHSVHTLNLFTIAPEDFAALAPLSTTGTVEALSFRVPATYLVPLFKPGATMHVRKLDDVANGRFPVPVFPTVTQLSLVSLPAHWPEQAAGWTSLTHLGLFERAAQGIDCLEKLPALTHLLVASAYEYAIPQTLAHSRVTHLTLFLGGVSKTWDLTSLPSAFPALTELAITAPLGNLHTLDLTGLHRTPHLRIRLNGFTRQDGRVTGADAFTRRQLRWT